MFFRFNPFDGPSSFTWKDPDTGVFFEESDKQSLIQRIQAYREQNNLEKIEHLSFVLESYWCSLPENAGKCTAIESAPRGTWGYLKGGIALLKTLMYNAFAPQRVAENRAKQCAKCPFNVFPDKGPFLKWSDAIAESTVGERKTLMQERLGSCAVCSCVLKAKVFSTGEVEASEEDIEKYKSVNCWQLGLIRKKDG